MQARMSNPATVLPDTQKAVQNLYQAMGQGGVPQETLELVHLRVSQINGCSACVFAGVASAKKAGESDERLHSVAAWRETSLFTEPERAALAFAEAATRIADRTDPVPDPIWNAAAEHFDEKGMSALILMVATTNFFNRINIPIRQQAGAAWN